ncbi:hypothetical protein [Streptomyces sp. NRRL F-4474]|uniref:hypothetical protein n=1 Tax=Streptomyces sp. NRRL F-4474 TaxID=1463851 RepID=UPI0004C9CB9E|nr:hypothetical protein [Streptomyces sp. NRRL F-4474]
MSEHRIGTVLATAGAVLSLSGAAMYVLPGPGSPVLVALTTGLVMTADTRRTRTGRPRRP